MTIRMDKGINELTNDELQERIGELEQTYAELFAELADVNILNRIWREVQLLQAVLQTRKN